MGLIEKIWPVNHRQMRAMVVGEGLGEGYEYESFSIYSMRLENWIVD